MEQHPHPATMYERHVLSYTLQIDRSGVGSCFRQEHDSVTGAARYDMTVRRRVSACHVDQGLAADRG